MQALHASEQQSPLPTQAASHQHLSGAWPVHFTAAQPQSAGQVTCVSPGSHFPSPQTDPPHEPQSEHASEQQSPSLVHAESQWHPAGAAPTAHELAAQPQSPGHVVSVSPGSHLPSPQTGPLHAPQTEQASGQQSFVCKQVESQKQPPGAGVEPHMPAPQPQSMRQLSAVSPGSHLPSPQTGPPHEPQTAHASGQQSAKLVQPLSQKQPPGAAPVHVAEKELQPQSVAHESAVSPTSQSPLPQIGPPQEPHAAHASGQQSAKFVQPLSQKQPAGATPSVHALPAAQPQSVAHVAAVSPGSHLPSPQY